MFVIKKKIVSESFLTLRQLGIHNLFAGYLCLLRRAAQLQRLDDLQPDFKAFFNEFFLVEDHPLGSPYVKPFTEQAPSNKNLWLNENVAGSYAPSSLRPGQPFRKVVEIENRRYSLPSDHAKRARQYLLHRRPLPVDALVIFLYRDYGLPGRSVSILDLIEAFAYEFGFSEQPGDRVSSDFKVLFTTDRTDIGGEKDWLERLHE